jgi:hypothetical protein
MARKNLVAIVIMRVAPKMVRRPSPQSHQAGAFWLLEVRLPA